MLPRVLLTEHPWLPCITLGGDRQEVGLRECLVRAAEYRELAADTPVETVALHRLLLAVLHRALRGPRSSSAWRTWWTSGVFPVANIEDYLSQHRERFFLFDPTYPFFQSPAAPREKAASVAKLMLQADNNPTLFDHSTVKRPPILSSARAARVLVATHAFDTPGMKTGDQGNATADKAPLCNAAITMARGDSLFETLMLNLVRYDPIGAEVPWPFNDAEDRPAWERDPATSAGARVPDGYCDWLTWQSRRVLLIPDDDQEVPTTRRAVLMPGLGISESFVIKGREPMLAFRATKGRTGPAWIPLRLNPDRAVWRDSHTLLQGFSTTVTPPLIQWLASLVDDGALSARRECVLDVAGLATAKAKCLFWRHERLRVPGLLLERESLRDALREAVTLAEACARVVADEWVALPGRERPVPSAMIALARFLIRRDKDASTIMSQWPTGHRYWSALDRAFDEFLATLPGSGLDPDVEHEAIQRAQRAWTLALRRALTESFSAAADALATGAVAVQAIARAERVFHYQVAQLLPLPSPGGPA